MKLLCSTRAVHDMLVAVQSWLLLAVQSWLLLAAQSWLLLAAQSWLLLAVQSWLLLAAHYASVRTNRPLHVALPLPSRTSAVT